METRNNPILSICIPTYNRSKFLVECLESVLESAKGYENKLEIIISDNASNDETTNVAAKYVEKFSFIYYSRNVENVIDENFFIAARLAKGKYVWIFADDDKMEKNAVAMVMDQIQKKYNLIILNYSMWDKYFSRKIKENGMGIRHQLIFSNSDLLLKTFGIRIQYLSSVIIQKSKLLCLASAEYNPFHEYGASFLLSVYSGVKDSLKGIYIPEPLVAYRGFNSDITESKKWYKYFVTGSTLLLETLRKKGYSKSAINKAKSKVIIEYVARDILHRKRNNIKLKGILIIIFQNYRYSFLFWFLLLPLFATPNYFIKLLKR
ncbi:MAG: glycosyltransferase family 2 protein [Elusimicrobiota bacterium]